MSQSTQPVLPSPRVMRETLLEILKAISGVQVVWVTRKRPHFAQNPFREGARILASLQSYQSIGIDELRQVFDQATQQNDNLLVGQRRFTLVVRAESFDAKIEAFDLCERVRFGFRTQKARELMVPTLALIDFGQVVPHDEVVADVGGSKRQLLVATLDVRMGAVVASDPLDPNEGLWIETVAPPTAVVDASGDDVTGNV